MAVDMDQQEGFKHFCRICDKGFVSDRALGQHMIVHGIGDETCLINGDNPTSNRIDKPANNTLAGNKFTYKTHTNIPNMLSRYQRCENCGKEFSSWKSFFGHGKCSLDDTKSLMLSSQVWEEDNCGEGGRGCGGWSKGKRTRRVKVGSPISNSKEEVEDEDLANCLMMLSTARVYPQTVAKGATKGLFECKACKKVFSSHQALGGHRASHKKVKGCFATKPSQNLAEEEVFSHENFSISQCIPNKAHECTICHRNFASGQALGGHKRCHWVASSISSDQQLHQRPKFDKSELLDLNLPATVDDLSGVLRQDNRSSSLNLQINSAFYPQQSVEMQTNANNNGTHHQKHCSSSSSRNKNGISCSSLHLGHDEEDSRIKLMKLSDLKDINFGCEDSSRWLQVGIGSAATGIAAHED